MMQKAIYFLQKDIILWGILSLVLTVALSFKSYIPLDFVTVATVGLFLSQRLHLKGFCYSLLILFLFAVTKHLFFTTDHFYQLGLESSLALSFFVIALSFEEGATEKKSLHLQMQTKDATLINLEDELEKRKTDEQNHQIAFQEKVAALQKELDEQQQEHASILILNEVLRKTTAKHINESQIHAQNLFETQRQHRLLLEECALLEKELNRFKNSEALALENRQLVKELNEARFQKEQMHLINETLDRLYARESIKAKEAESEAAELFALVRENEKVQQDNSSEYEPLYKQLRSQFEEKTQILHQVRAELFKKDTELQRLSMEIGALEQNPIPKEVEGELQKLAEQLKLAEEENLELQGLVSQLSLISEESLEKRKKKVKTQLSVEQGLLF